MLAVVNVFRGFELVSHRLQFTNQVFTIKHSPKRFNIREQKSFEFMNLNIRKYTLFIKTPPQFLG